MLVDILSHPPLEASDVNINMLLGLNLKLLMQFLTLYQCT